MGNPKQDHSQLLIRTQPSKRSIFPWAGITIAVSTATIILAQVPLEINGPQVPAPHQEPDQTKRERPNHANLKSFLASLGLEFEFISLIIRDRLKLTHFSSEVAGLHREYLSLRAQYDEQVATGIKRESGHDKDRVPHSLLTRKPRQLDVEIWQVKHDATYGEAYMHWGLPEDLIGQLKQKRRHLNDTATELANKRTALTRAKKGFLRRLEDWMSSEDFAAYQEWEQRRPAIRAYSRFRTELPDLHRSSFDQYESSIIDFFLKAEIAVDERWDSPYDPLPNPILGTKLVADDARTKLMSFNRSVTRFRAMTDLHPYPTDLKKALDTFFGRERRRRLSVISLSKATTNQALQEKMRQNVGKQLERQRQQQVELKSAPEKL